MKALFIVIFTAVSIVYIPAQTLSKKLGATIGYYANDSLLNGSILVAKGDNVLYKSSFGYKNKEKEELNQDTTLFAIGSVTKQFTSAAILILQQRGLINITDKLIKYIEIPKYMENVSLENLLNHTSGIPDYWPQNIENKKEAIINFINSMDSLNFKPNSKHQYSNSNYYLLGEVIEKVSQQSYSEFLTENIFSPLGMNNTFVNNGSDYNRAIGYTEQWEENDYLMSTADGGILSTVEDIYKWNKALLSNKILGSKNWDLMCKPHKLTHGETIHYGYGWEIYENNTDIVSHTGWLASFGAYNQLDKCTGCCIIILSNQIRPELKKLIMDVNKVLYSSLQ